MRLVKVVSVKTGRKFGINKCTVVERKKRKQVHCEGIDLGEGMMIEETDQEQYKNLGILESEDACEDEMKKMVRKEYFKRVRVVLKSSFDSGNVVSVLNVWAVVT